MDPLGVEANPLVGSPRCNFQPLTCALQGGVPLCRSRRPHVFPLFAEPARVSTNTERPEPDRDRSVNVARRRRRSRSLPLWICKAPVSIKVQVASLQRDLSLEQRC